LTKNAKLHNHNPVLRQIGLKKGKCTEIMSLQTYSIDTIRHILVVGTHTNNINTIDRRISPESIDILNSFAATNTDELVSLLLSPIKGGTFGDPPLYALAGLFKLRINEHLLSELYHTYTYNILRFRRFAEILLEENTSGKIEGLINTLMRTRLEKLDENDIALYFSQSILDYNFSLGDIIKLTKPVFENPDIAIALKWLNREAYNELLFSSIFPLLSIIDKIAREPNLLAIADFLESFKGDWLPLLYLLWDIDERLVFKAMKIMTREDKYRCINFVIEKMPLGIETPVPVSDAIKHESWEFIPERKLWPQSVAFPLILPIKEGLTPKGNTPSREKINAAYIDISGSNLLTYESRIRDEDNLSPYFLETFLSFCAQLNLNMGSDRLFIFDEKIRPVAWNKNPILTADDIFSRKTYTLSNLRGIFDRMIEARCQFDHIFIFTNHSFDESTLELWREYNSTVCDKSKLFLIQYDPFNFTDIDLTNHYYRVLGWNMKAMYTLLCAMQHL